MMEFTVWWNIIKKRENLDSMYGSIYSEEMIKGNWNLAVVPDKGIVNAFRIFGKLLSEGGIQNKISSVILEIHIYG